MALSKIRVANPRRAASLIEIMIVVAIIGTLIGLLIPAIQAVRNSAKKVQNQNNIKQILLAAHTYMEENNGQLPQGEAWPGEGCCVLNSYCTPTYAPPNKPVQTCSGPNLLNLQSVRTYDATLRQYTTANTPNPSTARDNWKDGTPYFVLLPFLDQKGIWDQSYGPMTSGQKYKQVDLNKCACTQWDSSSGNCNNYNCAGVPIEVVDQTVVSSINKGWQGGRVSQSLVKTFLGYGDPTSDFPGMPSPLSYPMFPNMTGNIEQYNTTSYQAYITEAYAGCTVWNPINPWNSFNTTGGQNFSLAGDNFGGRTYNSWAASTFVDIDLDPIPMVPGYGTVRGQASMSSQYFKVWTGVNTPDTQCEICAWGNMRMTGGICNSPCTLGAVQSDQNYPKNITDLEGRPLGYGDYYYSYEDVWTLNDMAFGISLGNPYSPPSPPQLAHISNYTAKSYPKSYLATQCAPGSRYKDSDMCHIGEWFYYWVYPVQPNTFWLDHPNPYSKSNGLCSLSLPMSMVPGSLNVGMLDGSVRSIGQGISMTEWNALITGQPIADVENW